jgi:hypothetical protein
MESKKISGNIFWKLIHHHLNDNQDRVTKKIQSMRLEEIKNGRINREMEIK